MPSVGGPARHSDDGRRRAGASTRAAVLGSRQGAVSTLVLDRPDQRNPLSLAVMRELTARLGEIGADETVRAVILGSTGPAFCAGHDLRELVGRDTAAYDEIFGACSELMLAIRRLRQPVIARVQGIATAAGCQLVAACDLAVASSEATFATPGVRIGLFCTTPMVEVVRVVGRRRALELLLTGDPIDAQTAADWGLVNRVVAPRELEGAAAALALDIARAAGPTVALGKRAFDENAELRGREAYDHASRVMRDNALAPDAQEGIAAFLEKRAPDWPGNAGG